MNKSPEKIEYKVFTIQDIETSLYSMMQEAGIASPVEGQPGKLRITDIEQAKSQNSMSVTLNKVGKDGWELVTINNSQLYIFQRPSGKKKQQPWQYKVLTLTDIDTLIFSRLVVQKAAEAIPDQPGKYKILDVEKAKSQVIMADIMTALGKEGWILSGVNKSDLYFFRKQGEGAIAFNPPVLKKTETAPATVTSQEAVTPDEVQVPAEIKPEGAPETSAKGETKADADKAEADAKSFDVEQKADEKAESPKNSDKKTTDEKKSSKKPKDSKKKEDKAK